MAARMFTITLSSTPKRLSDVYGGSPGVVIAEQNLAYRQLLVQASGATAYLGALELGEPYATQVRQDGAIGYWRLGEPVGATDAVDTISGKTAPRVGVPAAGQPGVTSDGNTATRFAGSNYTTIGTFDPLGGLAAVTLEGWGNHLGGAWSGTYEGLFDFASNNQFLTVKNGIVNPGLKIGGVVTEVNGGAVPVSDWHHFVCTWASGAKILSYLDGVQVGASAATIAGTLDASNTLNIACLAGPGFFFNGVLDEIAYYPVALSPGQIAAHYALGGSSGTPILSTPVIADSVPVALGAFETGPIKLSDLYAVGAGATLHLLGIPF